MILPSLVLLAGATAQADEHRYALIVGNNIGKTGAVGSSSFFGEVVEDPDRATTSYAYFQSLPVGTWLTFQALIVNPDSPSSKGVGLTNAIMLQVVP